MTLNQVISKADIDAVCFTFRAGSLYQRQRLRRFKFSVNDSTADSAAEANDDRGCHRSERCAGGDGEMVSATEDNSYTFSTGDFTFTDVEGTVWCR